MSILSLIILFVIGYFVVKAVSPKKGKQQPPSIPKASQEDIDILKKAILLETDPEREAALKKKLEALQAVPAAKPAKKVGMGKKVLIGLGILLGILILAETGKKEGNPDRFYRSYPGFRGRNFP